MNLKETQSVFSAALSEPRPEGGHHVFEQLIRNTGPLSPRQRLAIYRGTGLSARVNALCLIYPVCQSVLGTDTFDYLARDYAERNRPDSPDLNQYGDTFAEFIGTVIKSISTFRDYEYLRDLCTLEWLWHAVYYRGDDVSFDFSAFAHYSEQPEHLTLIPSRSLELMTSDYPVKLIWEQHREQRPPDSVPGLDETEYLCIFREDYLPAIEAVSKPRYELLDACRQGCSLAEMASDSRLSTAVQELPTLLQRGWISGFCFQAN